MHVKKCLLVFVILFAILFPLGKSSVCFSEKILQSNSKIKVLLNGENLQFDANPYIKDGRTLVPFRKIFEALGMEVTWNASDRTVLAKSSTIELVILIDKNYAYVNGYKKDLDVAAEIEMSRTFVPLRFIGESCGAEVNWDGKAKIVTINEVNKKSAIGHEVKYQDFTLSIDKVDINKEEGKITVTGKTNSLNRKLMVELMDDNYYKVSSVGFIKDNEAGTYEFTAELYVKSTFVPKFIYIKTVNEDNKIINIAEFTI